MTSFQHSSHSCVGPADRIYRGIPLRRRSFSVASTGIPKIGGVRRPALLGTGNAPQTTHVVIVVAETGYFAPGRIGVAKPGKGAVLACTRRPNERRWAKLVRRGFRQRIGRIARFLPHFGSLEDHPEDRERKKCRLQAKRPSPLRQRPEVGWPDPVPAARVHAKRSSRMRSTFPAWRPVRTIWDRFPTVSS